MRRDPAIALLALGQTLIWAATYYVFPALLLRWETDLGWSKADLTLSVTLAILATALASPIAGRLIDKGHGATLMGACAAAAGAGLLLVSLVTQPWQFTAAWILIGTTLAGCLYEPTFAIITRIRGDRATRAIIAITQGAGFASTISFPATYALAEAFGWRITLRLFAAIVILIVAPILWIGTTRLEAEGTAPTPPQTTKPKTFLHRPAFWALAMGFACLALVHGATLQHLLPILDDRGISPAMAILAASCIGPMQVAGRIAMMVTERHVSTHATAVAAFAAMAAAIALLLAASGAPALLAGFVILFGAAYGVTSIIRPLVARAILGPDNFGAKSGALALPYLGGAALSPYLGALIWGMGGYTAMLLTLLGMAALGAVLYMLANRAA